MKDFDGKVAFITGGASGIGLGMARVFLRHGMKVVVADIVQQHLDEAAAQLQAHGSDVHMMKVDVADRTAMARAADEAGRVFGKVHVLCNNAGVGVGTPIDLAGYEEWDWLLGVNLHGVINGIVSFVPRIKAHGEGGHVVNTSSMAGLIPLPDGGGLYSTSKFAVRGLSDSLRLRLGAFNIGVSVLCPGLTRTQIMESAKLRPGYQPSQAVPPPPGAVTPSNAGMDPVEVGERVLAGIRRNDAYILTHAEFRDEVRDIFDEILAAFPMDQAVDTQRLAFETARRERTAAAKESIRKG